uniref:Uncharacterized protein n=1 Tax=Triticum urartu TaxID=4572 RepID=A0A8R7UMG3_TRIUA
METTYMTCAKGVMTAMMWFRVLSPLLVPNGLFGGDFSGAAKWLLQRTCYNCINITSDKPNDDIYDHDTPNNIREFLEIDGIYVTTAQVSSHLQKYRSDCRKGGLSTMPSSRPPHSNNTSKNYSESQESEGSYRFHMRSQGARDINQASWLSGGASQVDYGILGNGNHSTNLGAGATYGHGYHHANGIGDINGSQLD